VYFTDVNNNRIRKVTVSTGIISTFAGNGIQGFSGDGGPATAAELNIPAALAIDASGNVYIADEENYRIRKVTASTGKISTIAGNGSFCYGGDGGPATSAVIYVPTGVAVDNSGNVYIADYENSLIRKVNTSGIISTIAGVVPTIGAPYYCKPNAGYNGDGIAATKAYLNNATGVAVDGAGNVYIADWNNYRLRKVTVSTGIISTLAGNGTATYTGDGGPATNAELINAYGVALDISGNVFILDGADMKFTLISAHKASPPSPE